MVFTVRAIIEVAGFPEEHIRNILGEVVNHIKGNNHLQVVREHVSDVKNVKDKLFSGFIELELRGPGFNALNQFCYDYMPSSIEILDMEKITVPAQEVMDSVNDMLAKLHEYHAMITNLSSQVKVLQANNKKNEEH